MTHGSGRRAEKRNPGALRHPGGFVFVGDPARRNHDDGGWHVGLVHVENTALAELVVLDANEPHSPALATVHITRRVPYGPYCTWAPAPSTPRER